MKKYLLTGLLVWVPLGITAWVLRVTIGTLDQSLLILPTAWRPDAWLGVHIPGLGVILTVLILLVTGLIVRNVLGRQLLQMWENILHHIPFVSAVYHSVKQVSDTLLSGDNKAFGKVLLVRYPHPDAWALAFQTSVPGGVSNHLGDDYVFFPRYPAP